jgi:copper homeostasis protein
MILEVCIDSVESAIAAERGGAQRVELCGDLLEGGVTPGAGLIVSVRRHVALGLQVMIRPRGGDFCYSDLEFEVMQEEIRQACQLGADGIVLGVLDEQARIDVARTRQLVELAHPLPVTFHRAIDMTPDMDAALEDVISTGAARILTSGGTPDVMRGINQIAQMVKDARRRIGIMPGSGVSLETVGALAAATGATEYHSSVRSALPSPVKFRKENMVMGYAEDLEYTRFGVQEERVRTLVNALAALENGK